MGEIPAQQSSCQKLEMPWVVSLVLNPQLSARETGRSCIQRPHFPLNHVEEECPKGSFHKSFLGFENVAFSEQNGCLEFSLLKEGNVPRWEEGGHVSEKKQ